MNRRRSILVGSAAAALALLSVAGCGSSSKQSSRPTRTKSGQDATVGVAGTQLGSILVDSRGRTLYLFRRDTGTTSTCAGACAVDWPPLTVRGNPTTGTGANASIVSTSPRGDGASQVTYHSHPLYLFIGDRNPGDTNGQGVNAFGGLWFAVSPAGAQVSGTAPNPNGGY